MEAEKEILRMLREIKETLKEHSSILNEHSSILKEHSSILNEHSAILGTHSQKLDEHSEQFKEHGQMLAELKSGQEFLNAEISELKNAKDSGEVKEQLKDMGASIAILKEDTWNKKRISTELKKQWE